MAIGSFRPLDGESISKRIERALDDIKVIGLVSVP